MTLRQCECNITYLTVTVESIVNVNVNILQPLYFLPAFVSLTDSTNLSRAGST